MSFFVFLLVVVIVALIIKGFSGRREQKICAQCRSVGYPKKSTPGSFGLEVFLWLLLFVPGLIYSIWRISSRKRVCQYCGYPNPIPISSPMGQHLLAENQKLAQANAGLTTNLG